MSGSEKKQPFKELQLYLGKSNHSNPNTVAIVRSHLLNVLKRYCEITVVEHLGGTYSEKLLKSSDAYVVVGHGEWKNASVKTAGLGILKQLSTFEGLKLYVDDDTMECYTVLKGIIDPTSKDWNCAGLLNLQPCEFYTDAIIEHFNLVAKNNRLLMLSK